MLPLLSPGVKSAIYERVEGGAGEIANYGVKKEADKRRTRRRRRYLCGAIWRIYLT